MAYLQVSQMEIKYTEVGVCGLSCRLCPMYQANTKNRCAGCKSSARMTVGCPFITCAVKKRGVEFCWQCTESSTCEKWKKHRAASKQHDSFKCYQKLEEDLLFISERGVEEFKKQQKTREHLLAEMLRGYNDGRSKSYYCIAATVLKINELQEVLSRAKEQTRNMELKQKAKVLHSLLDGIASKNGYLLKLRK